MSLWRFHLALDCAQMCQQALVGLMWKWQAPVAYKLPKQGARSGGVAVVGAVLNPFVWSVLLIALIPIHSSVSSLPNLSRAGFFPVLINGRK